MIENGQILSIQNQAAAAADGTRSWSSSAISSPIACNISAPRKQEQVRLGAVISGASTVVRALDRCMPTGVSFDEGDLMTIQLKTDPCLTLEVMYVDHVVGRGALDHQEIFLKTQ